ncbi:F-box protein PP2-B11-like [Lotus japonicus]|uniref:F-box protein PP2-B11-like n=1 Tax=Lotus japonicus TaxID=34305 RepID=UPI00258E2095|nr:F-box protein PP2-B11-like [Lotus japonicus]
MELPEECIADILCRTTPVDVARNSVVSKIFCSAAESDTIWNHFLHSDYHSIVPQSLSLANAPSKKALYLALSDHPIIIDQGKKVNTLINLISFQLDRKSGKKCYMLSARALHISRGDDERYCSWVTLPESRFEEVAQLKLGFWYGICGKINIVDLSSNTQYAAFLVFKLITDDRYFQNPVMFSIGIFGGPMRTKVVWMDIELEKFIDKVLEYPNVRSDGLWEIEMGQFFNSGLDDGEGEMTVMMPYDYVLGGSFYLEGIEVRPKI